jgi:two-component system, LytTR family, response regulator
MTKVIIIDDEPLARMVVRDYLSNHSDMQVVAECANGFEGLKAIGQYAPDLIFLDIQMPKISGLEMLELLDEPPGVIFTTAFDEFAIKAFESNAIDYLLKPFSKERFDKSISRWKEQKSSGTVVSKGLINSIPVHPEQSNRIVVKSGHNIRIIPLEEILYVEAYDDYIKIHIKDDCFLKKQTMQQTEVLLGEKKFVRVHRSYIVSVREITRIEPMNKETYIAVMRDETKIPLSKTGYTRLKTMLGI